MAKTNPYAKPARRDWRVASRPERQAINQARRMAKQDARQAQARTTQTWNAFNAAAGALGPAYQQSVAGIIPSVTSNIGALGSMLGSDLGAIPEAERTAGINNIAALGSGTIEQLGAGQQAMANYLTSGQYQGAAQAATTHSQNTHDLQTTLKGLRQQVVDLGKQAPDWIKQRIDDLSNQHFDRMMALKGYNLNAQGAADAHIAAVTAAAATSQETAFWNYIMSLPPDQRNKALRDMGGG